MKNNNLIFSGLSGGLMFALIFTILFYLSNREITYAGILGGLVYWMTSVLIAIYVRQQKNNKQSK